MNIFRFLYILLAATIITSLAAPSVVLATTENDRQWKTNVLMVNKAQSEPNLKNHFEISNSFLAENNSFVSKSGSIFLDDSLADLEPDLLPDDPLYNVPIAPIPAPAPTQIMKLRSILELDHPSLQEELFNGFCLKDVPCSTSIKKFASTVRSDSTADPRKCAGTQDEASQINWLNSGLNIEMTNDEKEIIEKYYTSCSSNKIPKRISHILGAIVDTDEEVPVRRGLSIHNKTYALVGMATQIGPNKLLTAKHVLFRLAGNNYESNLRNYKSLRYIPFSSPDTALNFVGAAIYEGDRSYSAQNIQADQAILTLANPFDPKTDFPNIETSFTGEEVTPLIVAGIAIPLARIELNSPLDGANWPRFLRRDTSPTCKRITQNLAGCLLFSCDTIGGLSGTPIFVDDGETSIKPPVIIGIHHGTPNSGAAFTCNAGQARFLNIAAVPNLTLIKP